MMLDYDMPLLGILIILHLINYVYTYSIDISLVFVRNLLIELYNRQLIKN